MYENMHCLIGSRLSDDSAKVHPRKKDFTECRRSVRNFFSQLLIV